MKPVKTLVNLEVVSELASRSNFRLGKAMAEDGQFKIEKSNPFVEEVKLSYKNGQVRDIRVESTSKGLKWKCSCSSRKDLFCEHCVALGLYIIAKNEQS